MLRVQPSPWLCYTGVPSQVVQLPLLARGSHTEPTTYSVRSYTYIVPSCYCFIPVNEPFLASYCLDRCWMSSMVKHDLDFAQNELVTPKNSPLERMKKDVCYLLVTTRSNKRQRQQDRFQAITVEYRSYISLALRWIFHIFLNISPATIPFAKRMFLPSAILASRRFKLRRKSV